MKTKRIELTVSGRTAQVILNRPEKRNALDDIMVSELDAAFKSIGENDTVKVAVLRGNGPAFCAGADLEYLRRMSQFSLEENRRDSRSLADLFFRIYELEKPVVAVVNGPALAGGCGLASVCDIVVASEEHACFGYPEVRIGFIPAVVLTFLMRRVGEGKARELVLTGRALTSFEAQKLGLANIVVREVDLESSVERIVTELLTRNSLTAMGLSKALIARIGNSEIRESLRMSAEANASARMTEDCKKGIETFLSKGKIEW